MSHKQTLYMTCRDLPNQKPDCGTILRTVEAMHGSVERKAHTLVGDMTLGPFKVSERHYLYPETYMVI